MFLDLDLPRGNGQKKNARLLFKFSCHCYSRSIKVGEDIPAHEIIREGPRDKPRDRTFCPDRYALSQQLPEIIKDMVNTNAMVCWSARENFYHIPVKLPDGTVSDYFIFMNPTKKQEDNKPPTLHIHVESAYVIADKSKRPRARGKPRLLSVLLGEKW